MTCHRVIHIAACWTLLISGVGLKAQSKGFTAHITQDRKINEGHGLPIKQQRLEETIIHASDGRQLQQFRLFEGSRLLEDQGVLRTSNGEMYQINYLSKTFGKQPVVVPPGNMAKQKYDSGPTQVIDGLACHMMPVILEGKQVGRSWVSNEYGIMVKSDITLPGKDGITTVNSNLRDIHSGEPDPTIFRIDPTFKSAAHSSH